MPRMIPTDHWEPYPSENRQFVDRLPRFLADAETVLDDLSRKLFFQVQPQMHHPVQQQGDVVAHDER